MSSDQLQFIQWLCPTYKLIVETVDIYHVVMKALESYLEFNLEMKGVINIKMVLVMKYETWQLLIFEAA